MTIALPQPATQTFAASSGPPGEADLIAIKLALNARANDPLIVVASPEFNHLRLAAKSLIIAERPLAVARGLARAGKSVIALAGDVTAEQELPECRHATERITYLCLNSGGKGKRNERQLATDVPAAYAATASVAFFDDYQKKLVRARTVNGLSFIEVHCPSPTGWGFDPSNAIEVSRTAVAVGAWPLFERAAAGPITITTRTELEPIERYLRMQTRFAEPQGALQEHIMENAQRIAERKEERKNQ